MVVMVFLAVLLCVEPERVLQMPVDVERVVTKVFGVVTDATALVDVFVKRRSSLGVVVVVGIAVIVVGVLEFRIVVHLKVGIVAGVIGQYHAFFQTCETEICQIMKLKIVNRFIYNVLHILTVGNSISKLTF